MRTNRPAPALMTVSKPLFSLGRVVVATAGAWAEGKRAKVDFWTYLFRHQAGDWGEVCAEDAKENDFSVKAGLRIVSAYTLPTGVKIWIITEADRSATTILLPNEY